PEDFGRLAPQHILNADLDTFMFAIYGWANGGLRMDLTDALARFRAKEWLTLSFFERFPQYGFLAGYDLSEYPGLHRSLTTAEQARLLLLEAIALYEQHG
ncbi:MAG TPA: YxiJ family protein, partial [Symbiobacteriaceae bacterium]|nr:YxiJ family protein [Symbiobacteriaceae bacterium]